MISPNSQNGPNIGRITIICGWIFVGIALLSVGLLLWSRRIKQNKVGLDDYLVIVALGISIALMAQTTWAIVDENMDRHETEVARAKFTSVVKVSGQVQCVIIT